MVSGPYCARWLPSLAELSATCAKRLVTMEVLKFVTQASHPLCRKSLPTQR